VPYFDDLLELYCLKSTILWMGPLFHLLRYLECFEVCTSIEIRDQILASLSSPASALLAKWKNLKFPGICFGCWLQMKYILVNEISRPVVWDFRIFGQTHEYYQSMNFHISCFVPYPIFVYVAEHVKVSKLSPVTFEHVIDICWPTCMAGWIIVTCCWSSHAFFCMCFTVVTGCCFVFWF